jgi:hypothetical protein
MTLNNNLEDKTSPIILDAWEQFLADTTGSIDEDYINPRDVKKNIKQSLFKFDDE